MLMHFRLKQVLQISLGCVLTLDVATHADEGMWTFENPPIAAIQQKYGFTVTPAWLDHLRLASVRLNDGGSGSFVSPDGLLLTNHHVALGQLQKLSTSAHNYMADGFYARTRNDELKTTDLEINVLMSSEDVTARIAAATSKAKTPKEELDAREAEIARIEKESLDRTGLRSDVVTLYQGAQYWLYRYKRYTDVRIVFAPEQQMAFFGGDPDNFTYPRYDLDFALFRVYENGAPLHTDHFLKWNPQGAADDELVFVSGHPGSTDRDDTVAELETARDVDLPVSVAVLTRRLNVLRDYSARGAEQARQAAEQIFELENAVKAYSGELAGLRDPSVMTKKTTEERALRDKVGSRADWKTAYASGWQDVSRAEANRRKLYDSQRFAQIRGSALAGKGLRIVQYVSRDAETGCGTIARIPRRATAVAADVAALVGPGVPGARRSAPDGCVAGIAGKTRTGRSVQQDHAGRSSAAGSGGQPHRRHQTGRPSGPQAVARRWTSCRRTLDGSAHRAWSGTGAARADSARNDGTRGHQH